MHKMTWIAMGIVTLLALSTVPPVESRIAIDDGGNNNLVPGLTIAVFHDRIPSDIDTYVASFGGEIVERGEVLPWVGVGSADVATAKTFLEARADVRVAYQARYAYQSSHPPVVPNDSYVQDQWAIGAMNLTHAWGLGFGSHGVLLAVLDGDFGSPANPHDDLTPNRDPACGGGHIIVSVPTTGKPHHGLRAAGLAAAVTDNGLGVAGVSQSCLLTINVSTLLYTDPCGVEPCPFSRENWAAEGLAAAVTRGAHVVSFSGHTSRGDLMEMALEYAASENVVVLAAAGNGRCQSIDYPANDARVIAVGALAEPGDVRAAHSDCGPSLEIMAPGERVWTTDGNNGYVEFLGTSAATPLAAGVVALMRAAAPETDVPTIRCVLQKTAVDLGAPGHDIEYGWGRVDAGAAVHGILSPAGLGC